MGGVSCTVKQELSMPLTSTLPANITMLAFMEDLERARSYGEGISLTPDQVWSLLQNLRYERGVYVKNDPFEGCIPYKVTRIDKLIGIVRLNLVGPNLNKRHATILNGKTVELARISSGDWILSGYSEGCGLIVDVLECSESET